jgi:predicted transcriptional regulator
VSRTESVDVKAQLSKVVPMLGRHPAVIVNRGSEYCGLVDPRSFYNAKAPILFQRNQTIEKFAARLQPVDRMTKIDDIMRAFYESRARALPYSENGRVTGVVERGTLLKVLLSLRMVDGKVNDAMTSPAIAISDEAGLSQAKAAMEGNRISNIFVVHDGRFVGLLAYSTIIENYAVQKEGIPEMKSRTYSPKDVRISEVIERNPRTVGGEKELPYAVRAMVEDGVSALVVTDGKGAPVGILTASDVIGSVMSKRRIEVNRVFISGFDSADEEYEPEVRGALMELVARLKGSKVEVEYLLANVKRIKGNRYDITLRVSTRELGMISAHMTDFLLDRTAKEAVDVLRREIMKGKDRVAKARKGNGRWKLIG